MTALSPALPSSPQALADAALREALATQWEGVPALLLDSPPGAGKTDLVERLAVQSLALLEERVQVVTGTNEQAFALALRLTRGFPRLPFHLFLRRDLPLPPNLELPNLRVVRETEELPSGPLVAVGNAARWSWADALPPFDLQLVDEAYQLPDYRFQQLSGMARRLVLVGDPGQIAPVVSCPVERWRGEPAGPHLPCPVALVARRPGDVVRLALPVSRRLPPDTVSFVQPAFYPGLPFTALSPPGARGLLLSGRGDSPLDAPLERLAAGASLLQVELPPRVTGEGDEELAEVLVALLLRLFARGAEIREEGETRPLSPRMVGIVCAHVSQVCAVQERLPPSLGEVLVETADRFQGLERPLMLVHHPLSGRADADAFHLDAGRLCVMLSRHRVACLVVGRAGLEELLLRYTPVGDRVLGILEEPEWQGWRAHLALQEALRRAGRQLPLV